MSNFLDVLRRDEAPAVLRVLARHAPGIVLVASLALAATQGAALLTRASGIAAVSPILLAILFGVLVRNTAGLAVRFQPGVQLMLQRVLKLGIMLLGIRLSLGYVAAVGLESVPIIVCCIATGLGLALVVSRRCGISDRLGVLIAAGTSICGATAIVTLAPAIRARDAEVSYAVACIALFGMAATLIYPFLAQALFGGDVRLAGLFLGTAIHDTAQVAGAGMIYAQQFGAPDALEAATVTKLVRNLFILTVIPLLAIWFRVGCSDTREEISQWSWTRAIPLFVFGFLAMATLRTLGDMAVAQPFAAAWAGAWDEVIGSVASTSQICLGLAMVAVGLNTDLRGVKVLGFAPLLVGLACAVAVGLVSVGLIHLIYV